MPQEGRHLAEIRAQVGMVFQFFNLFAHKTILDNVTIGPVEVFHRFKKEAREEALDVMTGLAKEGMTMVIVTHEMNFARRAADRVIFMDSGTILEETPPEKFFTQPKTQWTRDFLNFIQHHER